ncbi:MAG: CDP-alcohol phosphatidyltransferase family protein [Actinomycetota bacterium]
MAESGGFVGDERGAKKLDYWFTVLVTDPLAIPISRWLAKHRVMTPDQVTMLALVCGVLVFPAFALGHRAGLAIGGVLFYLAFVFDCVDGKLARATGVTSARGAALDALADGGRRAAGALGLVFFLWRADGIGSPGGKVDVLWAAVYAVLAYYFIEISGAEKDPAGTGVRGAWSQRLARYRLLPNPGMPDVQAVVFIFGPVTGLVIPALGVGIAMVTIAILLTVRRRLRAAS